MKVIAVDIDGILIQDGKSIKKNVNKVNDLFENKNNFIVIHTARSEKIRSFTITQLNIIGVKYHALVMEKLRADKYVDDKNGEL